MEIYNTWEIFWLYFRHFSIVLHSEAIQIPEIVISSICDVYTGFLVEESMKHGAQGCDKKGYVYCFLYFYIILHRTIKFLQKNIVEKGEARS